MPLKPRPALTELVVRKLKPRPGKRLEYADGATPGLVLRVTEHGVKSWSVLYRIFGKGAPGRNGQPTKGRQERYTIGPYPAFDLVGARAKALEVIRIASEGRDPAAQRREQAVNGHPLRAGEQAQMPAPTDNRTIGWAIEEFGKGDHTATADQRKRQLELHVKPTWRDKSLSAISRADVHSLLDGLRKDKGTDAARRARKHLSALFNWAVDRDYIETSPAAGLRRKDLRYVPRERALGDTELRVVWHAADTLGYPFGPMYQLLILTGQRLEEIAAAKRSWLDKKRSLIEVPADSYKSRRQHIIPLSQAAMRIIESLPVWGAESFLFSSTGGETHVTGYTAAKERLDKAVLRLMREHDESAAALPHWTVHDFRRTVKTKLAELEVPKEIRDRVLGHAKVGMDKTYDKHDYLKEKRAALDRWARRIDELLR